MSLALPLFVVSPYEKPLEESERGSDRARVAKPRRSFLRRRPWTSLGLAVLLVLIVVAYALAYMVEEPLRRSMEQRINGALQGYKATIGHLDLHPLGLAIDLEDVVLIQEANPKPPVASLPRLEASVQWGALIYGDLVADFALDSPELHINLTQTQSEVADKRSIEDRGWQQAAKEIYPLEINEFRINDGEITYEDGSEVTPIQVKQLDFVARNIRNASAEKGTYPSPVKLDAVVFGAGNLRFDGNADFLATPFAGMSGDIELSDIPLRPLTPVVKHYAIQLDKGTLSAKGKMEYAPWAQKVALDDVSVDGIVANFVREPSVRAARGEQVAKEAVRGATDPSKAPESEVTVDHVRIKGGELGYVDRGADPDYRLFFTKLDLNVHDFSNRKGGAPGKADARGLFMGSGATKIQATFQPRSASAEFSASLEIQNTDMRAMNDLFRAQGGFDVNAGRFSLFTEIAVKEGYVKGYVKPVFADLDVYDTRQDSDKNIFRQAYEGIVGGIGVIFENRPRDEVATRTDLSGRIENPETSTWEIVINLIQNAFFRAIMPGLERESSR